MKILFIIDSLSSGGKERRVTELIRHLSYCPEYEIGLVLLNNIIYYKEIYNFKIKIYIETRKKGRSGDLSILFRLNKIVKDFGPDILHVWSNMEALYLLPTKMFLNIPMINNQITNSTIHKFYKKFNYKLTFPFSDRIIANSYAGLKAYNPPKRKSQVIYNGFDFKRLNHLEDVSLIKEKYNIKTKIAVGMVASFTYKKDYQTYIEAANMLLKDNEEISFLCIGSGDSRKYELMVDHNSRDKVFFLGEQENIESIMNICDIGILMSNGDAHGEGISNAILEFNALGKPVIANNSGGNGEIIEDGVSGFLIIAKSPKILVDRINFFLVNEDEMMNFGIRARKIVQEKFGMEKMVEEFKLVYNFVLS